MDLATALELAEENNDVIGAQGFQALKVLHMSKVKLLLGSIDTLQMQLNKANAAGKDSQRSQMIQSLRNKLKDQELVTDILKEQLSQKGDMSLEEVNELIIRKTLGGPKRFRPLSREELENKIIELERKAKKTTNAATTANNNNIVPPLPPPSQQQLTNLIPSSTSNINSSTHAEVVGKVGELKMQVDELNRVVEVKDNLILQCKGDMIRLRARNAELVNLEIQNEVLHKRLDELKLNYDKILQELSHKNERCMEAEEELLFVKDELLMDNETQNQLVETLQSQCTKLSSQNTALLKRMQEMENEVDEAQSKYESAGVVNTSAEYKSNQQSSAQSILESKLQKLTEKYNELRTENVKLQQEVTQVRTLKDTLRDKNEEIREMQRNIKETKRLQGGITSTTSPSVVEGTTGGQKIDANSVTTGHQHHQQQQQQGTIESIRNELLIVIAENNRLQQSLLSFEEKESDYIELKTFTKELLTHYASILELLVQNRNHPLRYLSD